MPPRLLERKRKLKIGNIWISYYYNGRNAQGGRVEISLGWDLNEAKREWARLECQAAPPQTGEMRFIFDRYERKLGVDIDLAFRTKKDYRSYLKYLRLVFDSAPIDSITPQHIAQYRDERGRAARVRANREITLFSSIWDLAREWGYTTKENPHDRCKKE